MQPKELFTVAVRVIGVWVLVNAASDARELILIQVGLFQPQRTAVSAYAIHLIVDAALGFFLLFGARVVTAIVYDPEERGFPIEQKTDTGPGAATAEQSKDQ